MILNAKDASVKKVIRELTGEVLGPLDKLKCQGAKSPLLLMSNLSSQFINAVNGEAKDCFGEVFIRKRGVVISFSINGKTQIWVIPFWRLAVIKTAKDIYSLHANGLKMWVRPKSPLDSKRLNLFMNKVLDFKLESCGGPDLNLS